MLVLLFVVDVVRAFVPAAAALAPRSYTAAAARSTAAAIVPRSTAVAVEDDEMVDDKMQLVTSAGSAFSSQFTLQGKSPFLCLTPLHRNAISCPYAHTDYIDSTASAGAPAGA
eukprot:10951-Heterococcus_DN1.PRE.1